MSVLDLIFPKTCLGCGRAEKYICDVCKAKVKLLKPVCPYCEKASIDGFTHTKCRKKYGMAGLTSIWDYDGVIKKAILALKYKYSTEVGKELSDVYVQELLMRLKPIKEATLVPIPLYWHRQNVRGFNQSAEIGKLVAGKMGWKFAPDLLIKKKSTAPQAGLSVKERKENLKDVFLLSPNISISEYPSIILFDDVFTTGSTLKEAAKVLRRAGVKTVWGMTIAR